MKPASVFEIGHVPEGLGELERLVNDTFAFFVVPDLGVALERIIMFRLSQLHPNDSDSR